MKKIWFTNLFLQPQYKCTILSKSSTVSKYNLCKNILEYNSFFYKGLELSNCQLTEPPVSTLYFLELV